MMEFAAVDRDGTPAAGSSGESQWERVLYAGTFRRNLVSDQVDEISFACPVKVTHVRIVPLYVPDSKVSNFSGFTSPGSFNLSIFGGCASQPQSESRDDWSAKLQNNDESERILLSTNFVSNKLIASRFLFLDPSRCLLRLRVHPAVPHDALRRSHL